MAYQITDNCTGCTLCAHFCPTGAARGVKKARHAIAAQLCIECGACGRICPHNAVQDPFGRMAKSEKKKDWKKPVFDLGLCMACGICVDACPAGCLEPGPPDPKRKTAYPLLSDPGACLGCGFCARECPVEAVSLIAPADEPMPKAD